MGELVISDVYPDVSALFVAKEERRHQLAARSWKEKVEMIEQMQKLMPREKMNQIRAKIQVVQNPPKETDTNLINLTNETSHILKEPTMYQRYQLSHTDAAKIIDAIRAEVEKNGKGAAIAVCDSQGELIGFLRTDGCKYPSITIAINKAYTAAREQKPSKEIGNSSREKQWPMSNFGDPRYTAWGGGVPIFYQGQCVGGVGVSGLPEEEDMVLAAMGSGLIG